MLFWRDGHFADMVTAELAGAYEAPIYGMLAVDDAIAKHDCGALPPPTVSLHGRPATEAKPTLLWDGEWEITYVTFRDMGAAFGVAILGIYILVVAQFGSFKLPLVILTPIPLTLIGIVFGHWLFGAPFTAASMIGAATILLDPIFRGLAISLLFALASSTLLTVLVIPAIYVVLRDADQTI